MKSDKHFFSYSRTDATDFALKLVTDLKANGFNIWLDQHDIPAGAVWDIEVQQALDNSDCLIIVLSEHSVKSPNVLDELSYALNSNKRVFPLLKDNCKVPFRIDRIQRIDFSGDYNIGLEKLIKTLDYKAVPIIRPSKSIWKNPFLITAIGIAVLAVFAFIVIKSAKTLVQTAIVNQSAKNDIPADSTLQSKIDTNKTHFLKNPAATYFLKSTAIGFGVFLDTAKWTFEKPTDNKSAEFRFSSKDGDLLGLLITEKMEMEVETLEKIAFDNARAAAPNMQITSHEYRYVNNTLVLFMQMSGKVNGMKLNYLGYYFSSPKGTIQLLTYTSSNLVNEYRKDMEEMLNGFTII